MATAVKLEREFLGHFEGRDWYYNLTNDVIEWLVPDVRKSIQAKPGYKLLSADYSQIEMKLMAFLSQDQGLIGAINAGGDFHCRNAATIFGKGDKGYAPFSYEEIFEIIKKNDDYARIHGHDHLRFDELNGLRGKVKTTSFGVPYGATAKRIALMTGMTEEEAQEFIDTFFKTFWQLQLWLDVQGEQALNQGWTATPINRKRFYEIPNPDDEDYHKQIAQIKRWAGNHPIQGASADMLKLALRLVYRNMRGGKATAPRLYDAKLLLVVHDEIVIECKEEHIEPVKLIMADAMDVAYEQIIQGIPSKVKVAVADSWEKVA